MKKIVFYLIALINCAFLIQNTTDLFSVILGYMGGILTILAIAFEILFNLGMKNEKDKTNKRKFLIAQTDYIIGKSNGITYGLVSRHRDGSPYQNAQEWLQTLQEARQAFKEKNPQSHTDNYRGLGEAKNNKIFVDGKLKEAKVCRIGIEEI